MHVRDCPRATIAIALAAAILACGAATASGSSPLTRGEIKLATGRFLAAQPTRPERPGDAGGAVVGGVAEPLPDSRVVAFYGAPQMGRTILGLRSPAGAARALAKQAAPYADLGDRPVRRRVRPRLGVRDRRRRARRPLPQPPERRRDRDLPRARPGHGARPMLDIEPGRSTFAAEVRHLRGLDRRAGRRRLPGSRVERRPARRPRPDDRQGRPPGGQPGSSAASLRP